MVGTSKILTVSYGTFSCTLEGFDDSFNTMKAIAEYFRDLAADDRYFGAEPPTPDAEMLARIAEREIARRVEARMEESGVVLRPAALTAGLAEAAEQAPAKPEPAPEELAAEAPAPVEAPEPAEAVEAEDQTPVVTEDEVAEETPEPIAEETVEAEEETGDEAVTPVADTAVEDKPAEVEAPATVVPAHPDADSVAAKLQRIRAVVSGGPTPLETADYDSELSPAAPERAMDDTVESVEAAEEAEDSTEFPATDMLARVMARHGTGEAEPVAVPEDDGEVEDAFDAFEAAFEAQAEEAASEDMVEEAVEDAVEEAPARDAAIDAIAATLAGDAGADVPAEEPVAAEPETVEAEVPETTGAEAAEEPEEAPAPRHRVVRVSREQLAALAARQAAEAGEDEEEAAEATTDLGLLDGADEFDSLIDEAEADDLPPEEEAALMAELADLSDEGDMAPDQDEWAEAEEEKAEAAEEVDVVEAEAALLEDEFSEASQAEETAEAEEEPRRRGRDLLAGQPGDAALDRLMHDADAQMQEPESNRRRAAIAQLKAAVAANEAAREDGDEAEEEDVENAFRDDLDRVVRPRPARPHVEGTRRTERPRPAPLKLVAAQRVDVAADETAPARPAAPVRPRRIAGTEDAGAASGGFAEFAEEMGAHELPELLEAAAAYTAFVEGNAEFSRLQIMHQVRALRPGEFTREDGLRSFSELLRQGRLTKIANGRFQISEDSQYRPERRAG